MTSPRHLACIPTPYALTPYALCPTPCALVVLDYSVYLVFNYFRLAWPPTTEFVYLLFNYFTLAWPPTTKSMTLLAQAEIWHASLRPGTLTPLRPTPYLDYSILYYIICYITD